MFADFKISKTGDLLFKENDINSNKLKVNFILSNTNALKVSFNFIDCFNSNSLNNNTLKIKFNLIETKANKSAIVLNNDEAINQLLLLKLKTTLTELPLRQNFGSKLSLLKHKEVNQSNLKLLEEYVSECISDIISDFTVKADFYIDYSTGYNQTVKISVYKNNNNKNILNFIL